MLHLYLLIVWDALSGVARRRHRNRVGRWRAFWVAAAFWLVRKSMGLETEFRLPEDDPGRPLIFVSNHRTLLDIFVLVDLARRMGRRDMRWILKKPLRYRAGFIGRSCHETECAFVVRGARAADVAEVQRAALIARADDASIAIFPEGTRFRPGRETPYQRLLRPRINGLVAIRQVLPDHDIAVVTLDWRGGAENATTMFQNASSVGGRLVVDVQLCQVPANEIEPWIETEWDRKDSALAA
jgi:hypothetical protein